MSPRGSPKHNSLEQLSAFQLAPPDNRIITWDQFQGLIQACVKHQLTAQQGGQVQEARIHPKSEFKRFGEWMPRVDIWDDPESSTVIATFELPGVRREDLAVHVQDHRYLIVQGQRPCRLGNASGVSTLPSQPIDAANKLVEGEDDQEPQQQGKFSRAELRYGKFSRKLDLGHGVFEYQNAHLTADLREGMLTVTWPRVPPGSESKKSTSDNSAMITPIAAM
ncbi:HSP20-like chaperone [Dendrothele bispora CBS 962.96]|uniref:HSP20-like chaperone n=1 Tax=Dendrothele bispora (strain CBS 962.96) TaxID=1314807 RepID=A0A4S8M5U5_DENBC|nr:HSP20-like chaperone [Dendrothele bispora CBS 962.96]